jgi:hypothetical protein
MPSTRGKSLIQGVMDALARSLARRAASAKNVSNLRGFFFVRLTLVTAFIALAGVTACTTDSSTSPSGNNTRRDSTTSIRGDVLQNPITIVALQRTSPLAAPESASARIGMLGGQLSLPGAGLTVVVPPLALVTPVTITVTALAGSNVAYEFSPHGLQFVTPVVATQDLSVTQARAGGSIDPLLLFVGYFPSSSNPTSVTELLSLQINLLQQTSTVLLPHFSGYIWSSGRTSDDSTASMIRRPPSYIRP